LIGSLEAEPLATTEIAMQHQSKYNVSQGALTEGNPLRPILSSLTDFLAAGARPRTPFAKAIVLVLIIKLVGIVGMKAFMFPDSSKPVVDATAVARVVGVSATLR
jgi:hypothetical protein